ncbi:uncharacterized protein LOC106087751 [Stomoxys calcitrans]|uniref:Lipocalin/cytosolic fatty-acid binding domain-containing protein n=1 Tax=Stomoxys calcitrans TaxID=35570 RepID=A0A1I8NNB0_STOCA|nr:uncharacterized protein LOC106087751 [Stomoxys calcitrans]
MVQSSKIVCVALVAILGVLGAEAQNPCQNVQGMANLNATRLAGMWYEAVRAPAANVACIRVNAQNANNNTQMTITTWSSSSTTSSYMNQQQSATLNVTMVNANTGFNVTYNSTNSVNTTYVILDTDYNTYVSVCGYTTPNANSSFGAIFTTSQSPNSTWVDGLVNATSQVLLNFNSTTVSKVNQMNCYASSASTSLPVLSSVFAALYVLAKFLN